MINTVVEFIRAKHIRPSCRRLPDDTLSTDFNSAPEDETTINSARGILETKRPAEEVIKEWKEQHNANQEQQVTNYTSNIPELPTMQRPSVTRYGADIPKKVLDNIPAFDG